MKVCVMGLWHLGTVIAACLASLGHEVVGLDFDRKTVDDLREGKPPLYEPGLEDLVASGIHTSRLSFTTDPDLALRGANVLWVAYDTPVDENDVADVDFVVSSVCRVFQYIPEEALVLFSSQLPAGTVRKVEEAYGGAFPGRKVHFACSPENLRLGKAIETFTKPERVVVGVRSKDALLKAQVLFAPFTSKIEWMSVESAEMTKHAVNAFLALSVAFANEIAGICEKVGADGKEVERGLKTEGRIGPKAYLSPGVAFSGGTLARDIAFLSGLAAKSGANSRLLASVKDSNDVQREWVVTKVLENLPKGQTSTTVAVWGLTYKPGTNTLRRSASVELCQALLEKGIAVRAHDPVVKSLPEELAGNIVLCETPTAAAFGADVLVVATEWPEYVVISPAAVLEAMEGNTVVDPNRFLAGFLKMRNAQYLAVGFSGKPVKRDLEEITRKSQKP